MPLHSLYVDYTSAFKTSNTHRMTSVKAIRPDDISLFEPLSQDVEAADILEDPEQLIPGDVIGKDTDDVTLPESLNYVPSIGDVGNTFGADKAGSNVGEDGRMEFHSSNLLEDPPENLITHAQDVVSLIKGPEEDQLEDGDVPDDKSLFSMYEAIMNYFNADYDNDESLDEASLKASERDALDKTMFGLPKFRKYPLTDASHVAQAIRMFQYTHNPRDQRILAKNIIKAYDKFGMTMKVGRDNPLYKFVPDRMRRISVSQKGSDRK